VNATEVVAYVGLGSNLDDPSRQVRVALEDLNRLPRTRVLRHSALYRSAPLGPPDQPDFVNAVAMLDTQLDAHALLDGLQLIEQRHRRVREVRWGPRTLDLDLLLFADRQIDSVRLQVPHPQLHKRAFVLVPLHEIAADLELPGLGPLAELLAGVSRAGLQRIEGTVDV
jgi:2-amino-4-hydroxy-6-hydroxymethyldihydropteridine diphosphokinase